MNNIIIRKAEESDAQGIVEVNTYTWLTTYRGIMPEDVLQNRVKTMEERAKKIKKQIKEKNNLYVAVNDENKVVGILSYGNSRNEKYVDCGEINAIYVLDEYQGCGIGKSLFLTGINELINKGYNNMILNVLKGNKTISFYEHFGGKKVDSRFDKFGNDIIEEYIMYFDNLNKIINRYNKKRSFLNINKNFS